MVGFVFGFIRDRWSPFGRGDRAHLLVFASMTAVFYGVMALIVPTYWVFLLGIFVATMTFQMVKSAAYGITNSLAQTARGLRSDERRDQHGFLRPGSDLVHRRRAAEPDARGPGRGRRRPERCSCARRG